MVWFARPREANSDPAGRSAAAQRWFWLTLIGADLFFCIAMAVCFRNRDSWTVLLCDLVGLVPILHVVAMILATAQRRWLHAGLAGLSLAGILALMMSSIWNGHHGYRGPMHWHSWFEADHLH